MQIPRVGVFPSSALVSHTRLFTALQELCGVSFAADLKLDGRDCDAAVVFGALRGEAIQIARSGVRCLAFVGGPVKAVQCGSADVSLAHTSYLPSCFRGIALRDPSIKTISDVDRKPGDVVIAHQGADILWISRREGASAVDLIATAPPTLSGSDYLFSRFQETDWFSLLPLLHFVREVSGWTLPPARACFMFDDPNLHWKTYGYVKYQELVEDARLHRYHVSFATVPIDGWYVHQPTARLFREHSDQLSLLIHGNNHTHFELHRGLRATGARAVAAQALRRADRLERVSGVGVSRVMAAPHGACSHAMAEALVQTGYEAACISRGSLMSRNPHVPWPVSTGMQPADVLGGGLPILPRFSLRGAPSIELRLAMFLGQAVVPMGHHHDLDNGLEPLRRTARFVNSTGDVVWTNAAGIARTNFWTRRRQNVLDIRMYSRRIRLQVPLGINEIRIARPWLRDDRVERLTAHEEPLKHITHDSSEEQPLCVVPGTDLLISSIHPDAIDAKDVRLSPTPLHVIVRRQLCETRDRLRPALDRLSIRLSRAGGLG
jgi:hypothetical protein